MLLTGISIGVAEDTDMLMRLPQTDSEYRTRHYAEKINCALQIGDQIASLLIAKGYKAHRLSHPPAIKATGLYKMSARFAGLGWIGKNRLLVTPEHGCHIALAAVLTDAPLPVYGGVPMENRCGDCTRCIDVCPVHAYKNNPFCETDSLKGFDINLCSINRGIINPTGWGVCGLCVKVCPVGKDAGLFLKKSVDERYVSECVGTGDFNNDGVTDIVAGPYWYEGPDFSAVHEIFPPTLNNPHTYAPTTQPCFVYDFNNDGWPDIFYILRDPGPDRNYTFQGWGEEHGWAGVWFENPGAGGGPWTMHKVLDNIANEAPVWGDINGDGLPELIYSSRGYFGYAAFDAKRPQKPWVFHPVSDYTDIYLTSGAGFGDITRNGLNDLVGPNGWWENPGIADGRLWAFHPHKFAKHAAQMFVYDVDGDGLNDVITVWHAHRYGLVWHRQTLGGDGKIGWVMHEILPIKPSMSEGELRISQMHALLLADIDNDGTPEIITGKRFWAHGEHMDEEPDKDAVIYAFKINRGTCGVSFTPQMVGTDSGVGTNVVVADLSGNGKLDIMSSNKKGVFLFYNNG